MFSKFRKIQNCEGKGQWKKGEAFISIYYGKCTMGKASGENGTGKAIGKSVKQVVYMSMTASGRC